MSVFRFKRFNVVNERSAMKVNTDGVLLGAVMTIRQSDRRLLDIGTGTGTIALMAAQRLTDSANLEGLVGSSNQIMPSCSCSPDSANLLGPEGTSEQSISLCSCSASCAHGTAAHIDAIDIDTPSIEEAAANFANSPWSEILSAHHASLDEFAQISDTQYDLIFSNPPYFEDSLQAPEERRNSARHTATGLSYREIIDFAAKRLTDDGRLALVLPAETEVGLTRYARMSGLHLYKMTRIRTVPRKAPKRIIAEFSRKKTDIPEDNVLTIQDAGHYTQDYLTLMKDFYLFA